MIDQGGMRSPKNQLCEKCFLMVFPETWKWDFT